MVHNTTSVDKRKDTMTNVHRNRYVPAATCIGKWSLFCVVVLSALAITEGSFSIKLKSLESQCFVIHSPHNAFATFHGNYEILDEDEDDFLPFGINLSFSIYEGSNKAGKILWKSDHEEWEETFMVDSPKGGRHALCIENTRHEGDREVGFALRMQPPVRATPDDEAGPDKERALALAEVTGELLEQYLVLEDHYDYLRDREAIHRAITEQTFSRVVNWTILEAFTLIVIATGQVVYLKQFLEKRSCL